MSKPHYLYFWIHFPYISIPWHHLSTSSLNKLYIVSIYSYSSAHCSLIVVVDRLMLLWADILVNANSLLFILFLLLVSLSIAIILCLCRFCRRTYWQSYIIIIFKCICLYKAHLMMVSDLMPPLFRLFFILFSELISTIYIFGNRWHLLIGSNTILEAPNYII